MYVSLSFWHKNSMGQSVFYLILCFHHLITYFGYNFSCQYIKCFCMHFSSFFVFCSVNSLFSISHSMDILFYSYLLPELITSQYITLSMNHFVFLFRMTLGWVPRRWLLSQAISAYTVLLNVFTFPLGNPQRLCYFVFSPSKYEQAFSPTVSKAEYVVHSIEIQWCDGWEMVIQWSFH